MGGTPGSAQVRLSPVGNTVTVIILAYVSIRVNSGVGSVTHSGHGADLAAVPVPCRY